MDLAQGTTAMRDVEKLVQLWLEDDAHSMIERSGRTVMDLSQLMDVVESEMVALAESSRVRNGLGLQLTLQRRSEGGGAVSLRWKSDGQRMLSAKAFSQLLFALPNEAGRWYAAIDEKARWLNSKERLLRHARRVMRDIYAERILC